jgi:hypothetical protein
MKPLHLIFRNSTIHVTKDKLYYVIYKVNQHLYLTKFLRKVIGKAKDNVYFVNMYKANISKNKHIQVHSDLEYNIQIRITRELYYNIENC